MILIAISYHGRRKKRGLGANSPENFWNHAFSILGKRPFDIERALQERHFCSFAEKGGGLDPQDPLSCASGQAQCAVVQIVSR